MSAARVQTSLRIPARLLAEFRKQLVERRQTMNAVFQGLIEQYLAEYGEQSAAVPKTRQQPPRHQDGSPIAPAPQIRTRDLLRAYAGWIPGVVVVKEVHGRIICANDQFFDLIGRRDVVGQLPTEYFEHRTGELVMAHDDEVVKRQCPLLCVERVSVKDVPQRRIAIRFPIRRNGRIELIGAVGFDEAFLNVAADLNPQQSGKRVCRLPDGDAHAGFSDTFNSRALLEVFVDSLPAVAAIKDLEGHLLYANAEYIQVTGKRREDVIGQTTDKNWPGDSGHVIIAHDELVRETKKSFLSVERLPVRGKLVDRINVRFPIFDADGALMLTGSIGFDYGIIRQGLELSAGTLDFDFRPLEWRVA